MTYDCGHTRFHPGDHEEDSKRSPHFLRSVGGSRNYPTSEYLEPTCDTQSTTTKSPMNNGYTTEVLKIDEFEVIAARIFYAAVS